MNQLKNLLINIFIIVGGSLGGTVSVAFLMYWIGVAFWMSIRDPNYQADNPMSVSADCGRKESIALASILFGGLIGYVVGFIKSLDFLRPLKDEEQNLAVQMPLQ
jgi:hypothetical protein